MKVVLIAPTPPDISAFGVRSISAYLRHKGHDTRLIFLPGSIGLLQEGGEFVYSYRQEILDQIVELCQTADLVGVSFMTNYFDRAVQITNEIKRRTHIPVIWGGIHASTKPDSSLQFADMVCIGEGELSLLKLLEKLECDETPDCVKGIWLIKNGRVIKNNLRPLIANIDNLPYFDFSNREHFILNQKRNRIEHLNDELFKNALPLLPSRGGNLIRAFRTMTDRGCPHMCSYCNVATLKKIYTNDQSPYLRVRSVENVIDDLVQVKKRFPFVEAVQIFDDTFFARSRKYIEHFSRLYREKMHLPLYVQASPNTLTEEKMTALLDAGLVYVEMGIQTGSEKTRKLYRRKESNKQILNATQLLKKYSHLLLPPDYHIIIDNPWETDEDVLETVKLLYQIPKPYGLCIASLVFFPKTDLYEKALKEGLILNETTDIYRKPFYIPPKKNYVNFLIYLFTFKHFPRWIIAILIKDSLVKRLSAMNLSFFYRWFYFVGESLRFVFKGLRAVLRCDWQRISLFVKGITIKDPLVAGRKK
jgi:radical SAM superfamily enzyme YgiQ (UPF0313 family)